MIQRAWYPHSKANKETLVKALIRWRAYLDWTVAIDQARDEAEASSDAVDAIFSQLPTLGERRKQARAHNVAHNRTVPRLCRVRPSAQPDELLNVATGRAKLGALTADTLWAVSGESGDKATQPRSSEKNAASRAEQTPCARWVVTTFLTRAKSVCNG